MYLDAFLPDEALTPGDIPMLGEHFIPTCTVAGFPSSTLPGILDALNHLPVEYRWVTRFICLDKQEGQALLEKYRKQWWQKRKGLWTLIKEEAAKQEIRARQQRGGEQGRRRGRGPPGARRGPRLLRVPDDDGHRLGRGPRQARRKMQLVKQVIQSRGFTVRDETLNAVHAWLGKLARARLRQRPPAASFTP